LSHPEDHLKEVSQGNQVMSGFLKGFQMEKRYITKLGSERIGILSIAMLSNTEGQPYAVLAQIADLTRIKEMQREITKAQTFAAIGRMAQQITHDLKNILMVLKGTLDLLQDQSEHLSVDELELINGGLVMCQSGEQLVRSLLDFNPNRKIKLAPLSISDFIREQSYILKRLVSPVPFSLSIESEGLQVYAHRELFERALMNLCVNAKHAIEEAYDHAENTIESREDEISITLRMPTPKEIKEANWSKDVIYLEVNDTGVGIPDHLKEKILEPYVTTKGDRGGHGLGLFSVWMMCKQFNAVLQIESVLGQGSVFRFVLPLIAQETPSI
jgi:two-component system, cell cycle sensor histidine kinase and response regulator CckA